jgi:TP901 family phage tail tape measure protein
MAVMLGSAVAIIDLDIGGLMGKASQAQGALDRLGASSGKGLDSFSKKIGSVSGQMETVGRGASVFGLAVVGGMGLAVNSAANFEQTMSGVEAVLGPKQYAQFGGQLKDLALTLGKDTVYSANEAGRAIEELGKQGISATDILGGAAKSVTSLASATGTDLATSATITANAMNQFAIQGKDAGSVADILTNGANASSASVTSLGEGLTYVGGTAHALHIPLTDTVTALAELADNGMAGSMGGTALNDVLLRLVSPVGKAKGAMDGLNLSAGKANSVFEADGQTLKPLGEVINAVTKATTGMGDAQKQSYLKTIFGIEGARAMNALLAGQEKQLAGTGKGWSDYSSEIGKTGTADAQAKIRLDNLKGSLEQLKGSVETLAIQFGSTLLPAFRGVVDFATALVNAFLSVPGPIMTVVAAVTGLVGAFALIGGAGLLVAVQVAKVAEAFTVLRTVFAASSAMSGGGMFASLGAALPVILAVAAALGVLYLAYRTNFLGFGDGVRAVGSGIKSVFNDVTGGIKKFGDVLTGTSPKVDNLNKTQRAWVDGMRAGGATQEQINGYLRAQGVSWEYTQKKYDLLNTSQRAWVDGLRAGGATQEQIDGYLRAQGVSAEYTTSQYESLRKSGLDPLEAEGTVLITRFSALNSVWKAAAPAIAPLYNGMKDLLSGDFSWALDNFKQSWSGLGDIISGIDFGAIAGGAIDVAIDVAVSIGNAIGAAYTSAKAWLIEKFPWLAPIIDGIEEYVGKVGAKISAAVETVAGAAATAFTTAKDFLVDQYPWLAPVLGGTAEENGRVRVQIDILEGTALGEAIQGAFGAVSDAEGYVLSKVPWLGAILKGTGSVQGDLKVALAILENPAQGIGNVFGAVSDAEHYVVSKIPWLGAVLYGTGSIQGDIKVALAILEAGAQGIGNVFGAIGDAEHYVVSKIPWLGTVLYGTGSVQGDIRVALGILEAGAQGIGNVFGAIGDAEHYVVSKIPWLGTVLYGTGSVQGDIRVALGIIEGAAQGIGNVFGAVGDAEHYVVSKIPWLGAVLYGSGSIQGDIQVALGIIEGAAQGIGNVFGAVGDAEGYVLSKIPWLGAVLYGSGSVQGDINVAIGILEQGAQGIGNVFGAIGDMEAYVTSKIPWLGTVLKGTGSVSGDISVAINIVQGAGSGIADFLTGKTGTITVDFPAWTWPALDAKSLWTWPAIPAPTFTWPKIPAPTFTWPAIPTPGWVADLISALGGKTDNTQTTQTDPAGKDTATDKSQSGPAVPGGAQPVLPQGFGNISFKITAIDLATPTLNTVKNAIAGIPPSKLTALQQAGGEAVASVSAAASGAIAAIPASKLTALQQVGGESVAATSGAASLAINAIPALKTSLITQVGGETVSAVSSAAGVAINAIPTSKFSTIGQVGAETVAGASGAATAAIGSIPDFKLSTIAQVGADAVIGASSAAAGAIGAIPPDHFTGISQAGAEGVAGSSNAAMGAVQAIPTSWFTSITEAGGAGVAGSADAATNAISGIPTSHGTSISEAGSGGVIGAANGVANAVNAIPSSKTVTISIVRSGVVTFAKGGVVPADTTVARLAERGPELFRNPSGSYGMAMEDALYPMTPGARVFTAAQTRKMLRTWDGPAFAAGGSIPRAASSRVAASSSVSLSGGLLATVNGIVAGVQSTLQSGMQAATSTIQSSTTAWPTIVGAQQGSMTSAGTLVVGGLQPSVQLGMQAATTAIDTAATAWPTIVGAQINPMARAGDMIGTSMSEGAAAGIAGAGWSVSSAAVSVVDDAIAAANAAAGIASPSTEMIPVGEYMDAGLAQGIYNGQSAVVSAAVAVAQAAVQAAQASYAGADTSWLSAWDGPIVTSSDSDAVTKYFQSMYDGMDMDYMNDFLTHVSDWGSRGEVFSTMKAVGQDLANGVSVGIQDYSGMASQATLDMVMAAKRAAEESMGIQSPSKVFATIGSHLGEGLVVGMSRAIPAVQASANRLSAASVGSFANRQIPPSPTRPATPIQRSGGGGSTVNNTSGPVTVHAQIHTTGKMDDGEKRDLVQDIATSFRDGVQLAHMGRGV